MKTQKYVLLSHDSKLASSNKGIKLYRIQALIDFDDVKAGDLGGYIASYDNLNQQGNCWIYDNAEVYDYALVSENAKVRNNAIVTEFAIIKDSALVDGNILISSKSVICDNAKITGCFYITDLAYLGEELDISSNHDIMTMAIFSPKPTSSLGGCSYIVTLAKNYVAIASPIYLSRFIFKGTSVEFRSIVETLQNTNYQQVIAVLDSLSW